MCPAHEEQTVLQETKTKPNLKRTRAAFPGGRDGSRPTPAPRRIFHGKQCCHEVMLAGERGA